MLMKIVYIGKRVEYVDGLYSTGIIFPRGVPVEVEDTLGRKLLKLERCFATEDKAPLVMKEMQEEIEVANRSKQIEDDYQAQLKAEKDRFLKVFCDLNMIASAGAICNYAVKHGIDISIAKKKTSEDIQEYRERIKSELMKIIDDVEKAQATAISKAKKKAE